MKLIIDILLDLKEGLDKKERSSIFKVSKTFGKHRNVEPECWIRFI